jgi:hypothetical protein
VLRFMIKAVSAVLTPCLLCKHQGSIRRWSSTSEEAEVICILDVAYAVGKIDRLHITLGDKPAELAKVNH